LGVLYFRLVNELSIYIIIITIIIIVSIRHELGSGRPLSASSNSLFKGLTGRLRPFGL